MDPSPILDADGKEVLPTSEWLTASVADIELIITAVNAYEGARGFGDSQPEPGS